MSKIEFSLKTKKEHIQKKQHTANEKVTKKLDHKMGQFAS